jgi:4-amino-4-deoxy-L-arabinose transferase-like glycosyltransferase
MQERELIPPDVGDLSSGRAPDEAAGNGVISATEPAAMQPPAWLRFIADPRHAIPILLILGIAIYLVNLGGYPLYTKGEPREAVTVFDILHSGSVILPQRAGVEIPSKPLMMHWLAALVSLAGGGVNEFSVRLPSATLAIAGLIVCFLYVRRLYDDVTALIAALMMGTTFQYMQAATGARVDMTLTFFMEVAFFEFIFMAEGLTRRTILLYVAIALAVLTKGPIGLVLPGLVALIWIALEKRWSLLSRMHLIRGTIIVLVLAGGWYAGAMIEGGPGFFRKQILTENLLRFAGGGDFHEGHIHHFYYVELALMAGFMPWTILMPIMAIQSAWQPRVLDSRLKYLLVWFITVLVFYNLAQSKRGVYLLCLYPAFATMIAVYVRDAIVRPELSRNWVAWLSRLAGVALMLTGAIGLLALWMLVIRPGTFVDLLQLFDIRSANLIHVLSSTVGEHAVLAALMPFILEAIGFFLIRGRPQIEKLVIGLAAAMVFLAMEVNVVVVPTIANTLSLREFTDHALKIVDSHSVGYLGALNYGVAFYSHRKIPIVTAKDRSGPDYLIGWRSIYDALPAAQRSRFDVVMVSNPTSLDGSDEMVLLRKREPSSPIPVNKPDDYIEARLELEEPLGLTATTSPLCEVAQLPQPVAASPRPIRHVD